MDTQPEQLPLEMDPALDRKTLTAMRRVFRRWERWHPKQFEQAMADPVTRQLLWLAVSRGRQDMKGNRCV